MFGSVDHLGKDPTPVSILSSQGEVGEDIPQQIKFTHHRWEQDRASWVPSVPQCTRGVCCPPGLKTTCVEGTLSSRSAFAAWADYSPTEAQHRTLLESVVFLW